MGTGGSRLQGSRRPLSRSQQCHRHRHRHRRPRPRFKRVLSSLLICGSIRPSNPHHHETAHDPAEKLVSSSEKDAEKIQFQAKGSTLPNGTVAEFVNHTIESVDGTETSSRTRENCQGEHGRRNIEVIDKGKSLSNNKKLLLDPESPARGRVDEASTSYEDLHSSESESANTSRNGDAVYWGIDIMDGNVHQNSVCSVEPSFQTHNGRVESLSEEISIENMTGEVTVFHDCETSPASAISSSSASGTFQQVSPSSLTFLLTEGDQVHRDADLPLVDAVSVSSDVSSTGAAELSFHEARPNSRRLFWDALSRRGSRRNADSRSYLYTTDESDELGFHGRRLFDFSSDFFDNVAGGNSRSNGNNYPPPSERRWHSGSELWERFRDVGRYGMDHQTAATCASGVHPDGACSCGSMIRTEESGTRASISRIVMLAEALFEVLDEIHRPISQSLSIVSLPAPESVVDSLPVKNHKISERLGNGDAVTQCYICLADYEEGDEIRILPCHHEYHIACVDKWLKEIHGVCPLCRRDVRNGLDMRGGVISGTEAH